MPCTILPNWWLNRYSKKNIKQIIPINKIIGMTMWISGVMKNNNVVIKHTQRGYPLKEIDKSQEMNLSLISSQADFKRSLQEFLQMSLRHI